MMKVSGQLSAAADLLSQSHSYPLNRRRWGHVLLKKRKCLHPSRNQLRLFIHPVHCLATTLTAMKIITSPNSYWLYSTYKYHHVCGTCSHRNRNSPVHFSHPHPGWSEKAFLLHLDNLGISSAIEVLHCNC